MVFSSVELGLNVVFKFGLILSKIYFYFNLIELYLVLKNFILINFYLSNIKELFVDIDNCLLN